MRARLAGKKGLGLVARDITCRMGQADYILFVAHVAAATYSGVRLVSNTPIDYIFSALFSLANLAFHL